MDSYEEYDKEFEVELKTMLDTFQKKNRAYRAAFFKDDIYTAFFNIKRKYIRISTLMDDMRANEGDELAEQPDNETINETIKDLAIYAVMFNVFVKRLQEMEMKGD